MSGEFNSCTYAGTHLIIELWGVDSNLLRDCELIQKTLERGSIDADASVICSKFHHFGGDHGVTGVVVLAESHISIHTWPENGYAAIDVFMCGTCDPKKSLPHIKEVFKPNTVEVNTFLRGIQK